jgi:hypothetical protein
MYNRPMKRERGNCKAQWRVVCKLQPSGYFSDDFAVTVGTAEVSTAPNVQQKVRHQLVPPTTSLLFSGALQLLYN